MLRTKTAVLTLGLLALATPPTFGASGPPPFVTGTPTPVIVQNPSTSPAPVRDQDNPARHPFATSCGASTKGSIVVCLTPAIPAGQEVVIETISFNGFGDPGNSTVGFVVSTTTAGSSLDMRLNYISDSGNSPSAASYGAIQPLRLYADPGSQIFCQADTRGDNPSSGLEFTCSFSGYFVTLP
jgi:hypothetical protein